jgi:hypothetical protein
MELILTHVNFPYAFLLYLSQFLVFVMTCSAASLHGLYVVETAA